MSAPAPVGHIFCCLSVCLACLFVATSANGQTLYVTNSTNISTSQSYSNGFIGSSNALTSLTGTLSINTGSTVTVSNTLTLGNGTNTPNNAITVSGAGSELSVAQLTVGSSGSGNSLVVTNGATLRTDLTNASSGTTIGSTSFASNNVLTVTGSGSGWVQTNTSRVVYVGDSGDNNQLAFRGGSVSSIGATINIGNQAAATGNSLLVTDSGTILTNRGIFLGGGSNQSLVISGGAQVVSTNTGSTGANPSLSLGNTFGANATGHSALITGVGTTYRMAGGANIGYQGGPGSIVVSNGAQVFNSAIAYVGYGSAANGSSALVTGTGSVWSNSSTFSIGVGANTNSSMTVRDGAIVHSGNGTEVGANTNSVGASLTIDGATWNQNAQVFRAGYRGSENRVLITNGGVLNLSNNVLNVGEGQSDAIGSHSNVMTVTGPNSSINQAALPSASGNNFGFRGRDNSFVISNGATAVMGGTTASNGMNQIGWDTNSSGNSLVVTDAGSFFGGRGDLEIGVRGSSNFASVLNGGLITNGTVRIGASNSANANYLLVDGVGSVFSNRISVTVGNGTNTGNRLTVTNGGVLHAGGSLDVRSNSTASAAGSVWVGQNRPAVQTVNVLHTNANSNSVLTVNGTLAASGTVTVATRGVLGGAGTVQSDVIITNGGTLTPGNSPGTLTVDGDLTWLGGGNYNWQIHNATGLVGTGWDSILVTGALDLSALTVSSKFNINLWSLSAINPDANGTAINFDNTLDDQSWEIITAVGGITGFDAAEFNIRTNSTNGTAGFANALAPGGFFGVEQVGNSINLTYTVPEPSTYALIALAGAGAALMRWRKRKRH